jgi:predicted ATPase
MRFTHIRLQNWRNFKNAEVDLSSRAFFVGPNAAGKSNILDAFRFLRDVSIGGLASAVESRGGISSLRCVQATSNTDIGIAVHMGTDSEPRLWSYALKFNRHKTLKVPAVVSEDVSAGGHSVLKRPKDRDNSDPILLTQTHLEQVQQNEKFREIASFFRGVRYLHVVPQVVRDARRAVSSEDDPYGGDLLARMKATPKKSRDARLKQINKALQIAVPQFEDLILEDDELGRPHLRARYKHWRPRGAFHTEEVFSDGTLRLIGFLWAIGERNAGPLLLEEPELSLHDAIVEQLPVMIARAQKRSERQTIITTHSEAMLNDTGLGLDEVHRLVPTDNGTEIETAKQNSRVRGMVQKGLNVGEAVMPEVRPSNIDQLSTFDVVAN